MNPKSYPAYFKVLDESRGLVEQYCAVFNNVDKGGDRMIPGFFADAVADVKSGARIPAIYSHQWDNLDSWVGEVVDLEEVLPGDPRLPTKLKDLGGLRSVYQIDLDEPTGRKVFKLIKRGMLRQGSFAYDVDEERRAKDGANDLIKGRLIELGPTLRGMNELTDVVSVKSDVEDLDALMAASAKADVDNSTWDAGAAMGACDSAACYRSICAGERSAGEPDERQHWALPHHKRPGAPPNANGVRAALSRFSSTEGLTNAGAARAHLEAHMRAINPDRASDPEREEKSGRTLSAKNEARIQQIADLALELLASVQAMSEGELAESPTKAVDPAIAELRAALAKADGESPADGDGDGSGQTDPAEAQAVTAPA